MVSGTQSSLAPKSQRGRSAFAMQGNALCISIHCDSDTAGDVILRIKEAARIAIGPDPAEAGGLIDAP